MNRVILIGNLTRDPERRTTRSGVTTCSFTLAVERDHKDKDGNRVTDYITVIAWRNTADLCCRYLTKGRQAAVIGSWHNAATRTRMETSARSPSASRTTCNSSGARAGTTPPEGMTTTTPSRTKNNSRPPL